MRAAGTQHSSTISVLEYLVQFPAPWGGLLRSGPVYSASDHGQEPQILACCRWQSRKRKETNIPCLRENFCPGLEGTLSSALNEIFWEFWADFRGSPLEVPYRNRKSRAAELNWEFIPLATLAALASLHCGILTLLYDCFPTVQVWLTLVQWANPDFNSHPLRLSKCTGATSGKLDAAPYWHWLDSASQKAHLIYLSRHYLFTLTVLNSGPGGCLSMHTSPQAQGRGGRRVKALSQILAKPGRQKRGQRMG